MVIFIVFITMEESKQILSLNTGLMKQKLGCGEILLSSINYDGSNKGYDSSLLDYIDTNSINVPLIFNSV